MLELLEGAAANELLVESASAESVQQLQEGLETMHVVLVCAFNRGVCMMYWFVHLFVECAWCTGLCFDRGMCMVYWFVHLIVRCTGMPT